MTDDPETPVAGPGTPDEVPSDQALSDQVLSDEVLSDEVLSDEVVSDEVVSDEVVSDEVVSDEVVSDEVVSDEALSDEALPPAGGGSCERGRVPDGEPAPTERAASDHPGDDVGRVIAFPPRPGTAAGRPSDPAQRESAEWFGAGWVGAEWDGPDREPAEGPAASGDTFPRYGYDPEREPDFGGTLLTAELTGGTGGTVIGGPIQDEADDGRPADWAWVEEWRAGGEPVPWASGLGLAGFSALVVGVAVWVLSAGLAGSPVLAIGVNVLVAGGLAPAMWLSRGLPVLRWIALGSAVGVLAGWVCALTMLPVPAP